MAKEHLEWLEKQGLLETAKAVSGYLKTVYLDCLDIKKNESISIIGDVGFKEYMLSPIISAGYYIAAKDMGFSARWLLQEPKFRGDIADDEVIDTLKNINKKNIFVLCLSGKLGSLNGLGPSFRSFCKENNHRFVSTMSLAKLKTEKYMDIINPINIDYQELHKSSSRIKKLLDKANEIHVMTDIGTDLYIDIKGKKARLNTGNYKKPRQGGNIPAGEVYIAPRWKHVNGRVVIDGSSAYRHGTQLIKNPIRIDIEKDEIIDIKGFEEADNLKQTLNWAYKTAKHPWGVKRIGELGIGTNPNAKIVGATIIDEKTPGTAHIGIGSNYWFGGTIYAKIHLDQVFKNPKIYIDGELLKIEKNEV